MQTELDQTVLAEFARAVGRDGARQLATALLQDLKDRRREFTAAVNGNNLELARDSAHRLKSSVAYVGGQRLSQWCATLEAHARLGEGDPLAASLPILAARLRQIDGELRAFLERTLR